MMGMNFMFCWPCILV